MQHFQSKRRSLIKAMASIGIIAPFSTKIFAQERTWPNKPVSFIVPFAPGGPVDTATRHISAALTQKWRESAIVENRAGAGGIIGARQAAKASADGYHFFCSAIHHAILPSLNNNLGYDIQKDLVAVAGLARFPIILIAHPSINVKTVSELISLAKEKPGSIAYSSSGIGGGTHLAGALFASMANIELRHIPYGGSAPAVQDLVSGQVQLMFADATSALPFIKSGQVIGLGVGNKERTQLAPELPPIADSGLEGYEAYSWSTLFAPKNTPEDIIQKMNSDIHSILIQPEIQEKMLNTGSEAMIMTPSELDSFLENEIKKWREIIEKEEITI